MHYLPLSCTKIDKETTNKPLVNLDVKYMAANSHSLAMVTTEV